MIRRKAVKRLIKRVLYLSGLLSEEPPSTWSDTFMLGGRRAEEIIISKRLYLDPTLTISLLAKEAGTNRTYLSNYIHCEKGCNFREYVNSMRVNHAVSLIRSPKIESLSDVAIESGFSNLRSLNRAFMIVFGKLPSQVRREYLRENSL